MYSLSLLVPSFSFFRRLEKAMRDCGIFLVSS